MTGLRCGVKGIGASALLLALGCGAPWEPMASSEPEPVHAGGAVRRGPIVDGRGRALAHSQGVSRESLGPASLRAWVGGAGDIDGTEVGHAGIERLADATLLGGKRVQVTLEIAAHERFEKLFAGVARGAAVVIDLDSGGLRALFSKGEPAGDAPLVRRHLATSQPRNPGSTAKPLLALSALARGKLAAEEVLPCHGTLEVEGETLSCWGQHGPLDVTRALMISDNAFFYHVALRLDHDELARAQWGLGLGPAVGLPERDVPGLVPTVSWYTQHEGGFRRSMTAAQAIGHGALRVTPIQLARAYALLATGRSIEPRMLSDHDVLPAYLAEPPAPLALEPAAADALRIVREALRRTVAEPDGTAHFDDLPVDAAGKTGTADDGDTELGWFAGWAPAASPRVVVVVLVEGQNGRAGARLALEWLRADAATPPTP